MSRSLKCTGVWWVLLYVKGLGRSNAKWKQCEVGKIQFLYLSMRWKGPLKCRVCRESHMREEAIAAFGICRCSDPSFYKATRVQVPVKKSPRDEINFAKYCCTINKRKKTCKIHYRIFFCLAKNFFVCILWGFYRVFFCLFQNINIFIFFSFSKK